MGMDLENAYYDSHEAKSQAYCVFTIGVYTLYLSFKVCLERGLNRVWKWVIPTRTYNLSPPAPPVKPAMKETLSMTQTSLLNCRFTVMLKLFL